VGDGMAAETCFFVIGYVSNLPNDVHGWLNNVPERLSDIRDLLNDV
jgi:hypothetical protein